MIFEGGVLFCVLKGHDCSPPIKPVLDVVREGLHECNPIQRAHNSSDTLDRLGPECSESHLFSVPRQPRFVDIPRHDSKERLENERRERTAMP
jgi:hypothetical protein